MRAIYPSSRTGKCLISKQSQSSTMILITRYRIRCEEDYIIGLRRLYNRSKAIDSLHEEYVKDASMYGAEYTVAYSSESKSQRVAGRGMKCGITRKGRSTQGRLWSALSKRSWCRNC